MDLGVFARKFRVAREAQSACVVEGDIIDVEVAWVGLRRRILTGLVDK